MTVRVSGAHSLVVMDPSDLPDAEGESTDGAAAKARDKNKKKEGPYDCSDDDESSRGLESISDSEDEVSVDKAAAKEREVQRGLLFSCASAAFTMSFGHLASMANGLFRRSPEANVVEGAEDVLQSSVHSSSSNGFYGGYLPGSA